MAVDVFSDGHNQLFEILENAAPKPVLGEAWEAAHPERGAWIHRTDGDDYTPGNGIMIEIKKGN